MGPTYEVSATVLEVHDGDTVHLQVTRSFSFPVDPWFKSSAQVVYTWGPCDVKCRLARCNAPELASPQGPAARDALKALLAQGPLRVITSKVDKYDRPLAEIFVKVGDQELNVVDQLLAAGYVKLWDGHGEKPV